MYSQSCLHTKSGSDICNLYSFPKQNQCKTSTCDFWGCICLIDGMWAIIYKGKHYHVCLILGVMENVHSGNECSHSVRRKSPFVMGQNLYGVVVKIWLDCLLRITIIWYIYGCGHGTKSREEIIILQNVSFHANVCRWTKSSKDVALSIH